MSTSVVSRFPGSFTAVDFWQLIKTTHAMNLKNKEMMSIEYFNGLKKACKPSHFNSRLHQKMLYQIIKSIPSVLVGITSPYSHGLPRFPKYKMYSSKQNVIRKIGNLPIEIINIINDYAFERFDEVCYSLFYHSVEVYKIFELDVVIMNSTSRRTIDTIATYSVNYDPYNVIETWVWANEESSLRLSACNCRICGGYKTTNTTRISPRVLCRCNAHT
jgi:hypothetical protein